MEDGPDTDMLCAAIALAMIKDDPATSNIINYMLIKLQLFITAVLIVVEFIYLLKVNKKVL